MDFLEILRQPSPVDLPCQADGDNDRGQGKELDQQIPDWHPRRLPAGGRRRRPDSHILRTDQPNPERHPQDPDRADDDERELPRTAKGAERLDDDRRQHRPEGRPALKDAVAKGTVLIGEDVPGGDQRARPVPGLEQTEQGAAEEQPPELPFARFPRVADHLHERGPARQRGGEPGRRPADEDERVEPARADPVRDQPEQDSPEREGITETLFQSPVSLVIQVNLRLQLRGGNGEGQPVHVKQHGGEQQGPAHPPLPGRAAGRGHTSHSRPSQLTTRLRSALTALANDWNSPSPFSAVACRGKPMCPGTLRSGMTHARWAGSNARPNGTSGTFVTSPTTRCGASRRIIDVSHSHAWPMRSCWRPGTSRSGSAPAVQ